MKLIHLNLLILLFTCSDSFSQSNESQQNIVNKVNNIVSLFKARNIEAISNQIIYPLNRNTPIHSVKNKEEFKVRFNEIFDSTLINMISKSKISQWSEVGWRGIMLGNGQVWIDSYSGKIIEVTYQSDFEKQQMKQLIQKEKDNIYSSLKIFERPKFKIQTKHFYIRVDELKDYKFRYASWKIGSSELTKPNLVLENGVLEHEGTSGNHFITFKNGEYKYIVYRSLIGEENTPEISVEVFKNDKLILKEDGILLE